MKKVGRLSFLSQINYTIRTLMRHLKVSSLCHLHFTGFLQFLKQPRLKGILDVTCITVVLPGLICLMPLSPSVSQYRSVFLSPHLTCPAYPPISPALLPCHSVIQHIKEPWLVWRAHRPPVSFTPGSNEKCPLSFSLQPFEVPPSTRNEGGLCGVEGCVTQHRQLLCRLLRLKADMAGLKGSGAMMAFVDQGNLCFYVGVCFLWRAVSKTVHGIVAVRIKRLASKWDSHVYFIPGRFIPFCSKLWSVSY